MNENAMNRTRKVRLKHWATRHRLNMVTIKGRMDHEGPVGTSMLFSTNEKDLDGNVENKPEMSDYSLG